MDPHLLYPHFMFEILQARLQQYVNWELPDVKAEFRKGRGTGDQIDNICWIVEKAREFQKKTSLSASLIMLKSFIFYFYFFQTLFFFNFIFYFIFKLYTIVLVLPNIKMNPPQIYMCSSSWTLLPPPTPYHPSGSSQCTSPLTMWITTNCRKFFKRWEYQTTLSVSW